MKENREISLLDNSDVLEKPPRVFIALEAMKKIQCFNHLVSGEITGLGTVEKRGNDFLITDAFILKQKVSAGSAELDPLALNQFVGKHSDPSKLKFQWHSHGSSSTFFSSTDKDTMKGLFSDFMISLVMNKEGEYRCRLDLYKPFYVGLGVPLLVVLPIEEELQNYCYEEIDQKVEEAGFSLRRKLPKKLQKVLGVKDSRVKGWSQEKDPVAIPLTALTPEEGGKDEFSETT